MKEFKFCHQCRSDSKNFQAQWLDPADYKNQEDLSE